ncbi:MAG: MFS transporter [Halieaceae bacterium]|jgi:MFS family permease|nr:MFS transporter [Halieaceae bacterium]
MASPRFTLAAVMLVSLLGTAGIALPYPVLSPYFLDSPADNPLTHYLGLDPKLLLGALLALYPLGLIFGSSVIGALSDLFGRKPVLIVTLLASALCYGLTGYAVLQQNFPLFALARFLTGLFEGNIAVSRAIALDLHPHISRTRALSMMYATTYLGWLLGPLAGGYLMILGVAEVFLIAGGVTLLATLLVQIAIAGRSPEDAQTRRSLANITRAMREQNSLGLVRERPMQPLLLYHILYSLGLNLFYEFYPLWLVEKFAFDSVRIGWTTVAITASMILCSVYGVSLLETRYGALPGLRRSSLALACVLLLLPLSGPAALFPVFIVSGGIIACCNGIFPAYMANRFEAFGMGRVQGLLTTNFCIANVVSALFGSVIALAGVGWAVATGGGLIACASLWLWRWREPRDAFHGTAQSAR